MGLNRRQRCSAQRRFPPLQRPEREGEEKEEESEREKREGIQPSENGKIEESEKKRV